MAIHPKLKVLQAALIRQNLNDYFDSEAFELLLMENNLDEFFNFKLRSIGLYSKDAKIRAFISMINDFFLIIINSPQNSNTRVINYNQYSFTIITVLLHCFENSQFNIDEIIEKIKSNGLLKAQDVKIIEQRSLRIKKQFEKMKEEKNIDDENKVILEDEKIDYAIITALEDDEMEMVLPFINRISEVDNTRNFIEIGELKSFPDKKVVYASQHNTGMVDASILASEIICRFHPKYLIMVGVLGGKPEETNIGDVIVATKVFEIDRGKLSEIGFKKESSISPITSKANKKIHREKEKIESYLSACDETRKLGVRLHFGPIACVNHVIDIEGYFESNITPIDRKAIALEMESFAIVRSCELLNDGKTTPIIIKSVMDNTKNKDDNSKHYAAWTSAKTLEYLLDNQLI